MNQKPQHAVSTALCCAVSGQSTAERASAVPTPSSTANSAVKTPQHAVVSAVASVFSAFVPNQAAVVRRCANSSTTARTHAGVKNAAAFIYSAPPAAAATGPPAAPLSPFQSTMHGITHKQRVYCIKIKRQNITFKRFAAPACMRAIFAHAAVLAAAAAAAAPPPCLLCLSSSTLLPHSLS